MDKLNNKIKIIIGVACSLGYGIFFQIHDMCYKYTYNHSKVEAMEGLLLRSITGFVVISSHMLADRRSPLENKRNTLYLILVGVIRIAGALLFHYSLKLIDMGTATVILAVQPLCTILFAWILLKEMIKLSENLIGIISYVGVIMVIWNRLEAPKPDPRLYVIGLTLCFLAIICFSLDCVMVRKISGTGKTDMRKTLFWINLVGVVMLSLGQLIFRTDLT